MASKPQYRPIRSLVLLLVIVVGAFGWILNKGFEPKLGLDLRGGTSVILTPDSAKTEGTITQARLDKAVDIISQRVNGTGVAEAEVVREGTNILVALPSVGRDQALDLVGRTAQLTFRPILSSAAGDPNAPVPTPEPSIAASIAVGSPSGSAAPAASGTAGPAASGTAGPSPNGRPVSGALLAQAATPTPAPPPASSSAAPAPTKSGAPAPSGSAAPGASASAAPGGAADVVALQGKFNALDCTDPEQVAKISAEDDPAKSIVACERDGSVKYILGPSEVKGSALKTASQTIDQVTGSSLISFELTKEGTKQFGEVTTKYQGQQLAIVLDGVVQSAPTIQQPITNGEGQITGQFSDSEAKDLANVLKFGALPLAFEQSQTQTISPTLGEEQLDAGLLAGILGLAIVVVYLLIYYRALGLVVTVGLGVFGLLNYAAVTLLGNSDIGFTLTLAGIVGLIVSIGISGDSYVVFFERIKDELRAGRSPRVAVDRGFVGARRTILTANFVSFLAAATLYLLSVGAVRGFAFTLGLATLIDAFVFFVFTRPVTTLLARSPRFADGPRFGIKSLNPVRTAASTATVKEA
ncbi:MAG TPA: protein translocase subunit SecD [Mycobacteriales bacterium]|nr:protein translocase subunit SecD [Mycobacteriales bacterium]